MGWSYRRTSTTTNEHDISTGPRVMLLFGRLATRPRIDKRSKPEDEYTGRPRGDWAEKGGGQNEVWALLSVTGGGTGGLGDDGRTVA